MKLHRVAFAIVTAALILGAVSLPVAANLGLMSGDAAEVAYTDGDGVSLRAEAGVDAELITTLPEGHAVIIDDGPYTLDDGSSWYAVTAETEYGTLYGWVHAGYLEGVGTAPEGVEFIDDSDSAAAGVPLIVSTGGDDLNLRAGPAVFEAVIDVLPDGASVEVLDTTVYDADGAAWSLVRFNGSVGYAASAYIIGALTIGDGAPAAEPVVDDAQALGEVAIVAGTGGDGVFVRSEPSALAGALASIEEGTLVALIDGPVSDEGGALWYFVESAEVGGWVHGDYLAVGASATGLAAVGNPPGNTGAGFVAAAYEYVGVPYVWGGSDPDGFDCSGFTYYIVNQVLGNDFPRALEEQLDYGQFVNADELLPGDIIYFQNTYQWGLSHIGFYLGNGQFISATGEHGAVGVSNLTDPYWSARYTEARRLS